jgi:DNA-binding Lrp family transcriptional regulator
MINTTTLKHYEEVMTNKGTVVVLDSKDVQIINLYLENPLISEKQISKILNISQPSVNNRISNLKNKKVLSFKAIVEKDYIIINIGNKKGVESNGKSTAKSLSANSRTV